MISALAGRTREQARTATARMRTTRRLYEFTRRLSGLAARDDIAEAAASEIHASLGRPTVVLFTRDDDLVLRSRLAAGRRTRHRGHDSGPLGVEPQGAGRHRHRDAADRAVAVPAAELGTRHSRRDRAWRRRRARFRGAHADRHAGRPDRGGAGARDAGTRDGEQFAPPPRPNACATPARLDLARLPHAAVLDPRFGHEPARLSRRDSARDAPPTCSNRSGTRR